MAFQPVPNGVGVRIQYEYLDEQVENTLALNRPGNPDLTDLGLLADTIRDHWVANFMPVMSSALTLQRVVVTDLRVENGLQYISEVLPPQAGGNPVAGLPGNVALCISFRTGFTGRSFRGRNYIVGLTEGQVTGNEVAAATAASLVAVYSGLGPLLDPQGADHAVLSRFANGVMRPAGVLSTVVSYQVVDLFVDSQRRRLPGRGR